MLRRNHGELSETPAKLGYEFKSSAVTCVNLSAPLGEQVETTGSATVKGGVVEATCLGKTTNVTDGAGEVVDKNGVKHFFDLDVTGSEKGVVNLEVEEPPAGSENNEATGKAWFFLSKNQSAEECVRNKVSKLEFEAVTEGELK